MLGTEKSLQEFREATGGCDENDDGQMENEESVVRL